MRIQEYGDHILIVQFPDRFRTDGFLYKGYQYTLYKPSQEISTGLFWDYLAGEFSLPSEADSLLSFYKMAGIYFTNPLPKPVRYDWDLIGKSPSYEEHQKRWEEMERNLWDISNTYTFTQ